MDPIREPQEFYAKDGDPDALMHHLKIKKGDVARYVLLPGDPKRCALIAKFFDNPKLIADFREYVTITGTYKGVQVSVCSTGIGGPSASIALEELVMAGADTFIRVGTAGSLSLDVTLEDVVIAQAAVRDEGTSAQYITEDYPACADFSVVCALEEAAIKLNLPHKTGIVHSKDSFYAEIEPEHSFFRENEEKKLIDYTRLGVLASEMEAAALFSVGALRRARTGAILKIVGASMGRLFNRPFSMASQKSSPIESVIQTALDAFCILAKNDARG